MPKLEPDHNRTTVSHSSELPLIFGNIDEEDLPLLEIKETRALAERVRNRYISFAYELNPGG
jgi:carboxylesterase type B